MNERNNYATALKIAVAAQKDLGDPLGMDAYIRSELAIAVIAAMWGRNLNKIRIEESKAEPNATVLKELNDKQALYHKEKDEVYRGNIAVQEHVIRDYAPLLKKEYEGI